ncbi:ABC transporter permease [Amycolatopsis methanolica]|uniref:ABC transporter permease n=1 Tax=Amycolatopsis methanolica TaxID=1814 RepID=UPI00343F2FC5
MFTDSATTLRRNLRHALRYPSMTASVVAVPIMMLLLFNYVFGGAIGNGIAGAPAGGDYLGYLVPGILLLTIGSASMPVAVAMGFRTSAGFGDWLLAAAVLLLLTLGLSWFSAALGQLSKTPEGASNVVLPMTFLLPFLSSAFVPLDSMPAGIRWFAEYQPFTAVIETLRGLLAGTPIGWYGWGAIGWGAGITVLGYFWSKRLFNREPTR